ncbi:hypothetical protein B0O99DRAFT_636659 [Bisporella sp. PMI_857]|nr:hypothetical protein B0O99DRAFT_636659 [Bisporella sp. PMI_857]
MYDRALRGYEKALGVNNITTYIPALNTFWALASLFERQADFTNAKIMYSKALAGYEKVVAPNHPSCQSLRGTLQALHIVAEKEAIKGINKSVNNSYRETSSLDTEKSPPNHNAISYPESLG